MQHYTLDLLLPMTTGELQGTCTMSLLLKSPADSIVLNAAGLLLDTVRVDGTPKRILADSSAETFTLYLEEMRNAGEVLLIEVPYRRPTGYRRPGSRLGYYHFSTDSVAGLPANVGYTLSEPSDTRFWMPCFDEPWDKATAEIMITVPTGYVAASNGRLVQVTDRGDGTQTWHWREDHQIAPYLLCVTVSVFSVSRLPYVTAGGDTIPVEYYVWNSGLFEDSSAAASYLPTVRSMLAAFAGAYGEYPFDKYGMTAVLPFGLGGMEHQTITTLNGYLFADEHLVAHELAHQWWGDLVTCATWQDIWLNESFATYSEAIWQESKGGKAALRQYMKDSLTQFNYLSWTGAVYDPVGQGFNLFDLVVYSKGAWVLHTLRGAIGDSAFFRVLHAYRLRFEGGNATTTDFIAVVDSVTGSDYGWFFDQWIYGRGWPEYALSHSWHLDTLSLSLYQEQDVSWPTYTMPLTVRAYHGSDSTTFLVRDSLRTQLFQLPLPVRPDSVLLDPDGWVLKQIVPVLPPPPPDDLPLSFALFQNSPNPFNPETEIRFQIADVRFVRLAVYDLLGREVTELVNEKKGPGMYAVTFDARLPGGAHSRGGQGGGVASGVYFYRLTAGEYTETRKMILLR
jgi:aminopeptidase N